MAKIRPFYDMIYERCLQYCPDCDDLSVDESTTPYYGGNCSKQHTKNKPVRVGYKMWVLAESFGYIVQFDPYQGTKQKSVHVHFAYIMGGVFPFNIHRHSS